MTWCYLASQLFHVSWRRDVTGTVTKVLLFAVWCCKSCECCFVPWWEQGCTDVFLGTTVSDGWYGFPACLGFQCWGFDLLVAALKSTNLSAVQRKQKCITRYLQSSPSLAGEFPPMLINTSAVPGVCQKSVFILVF